MLPNADIPARGDNKDLSLCSPGRKAEELVRTDASCTAIIGFHMSATRRKSRKRATPALGPIPQIITRIPRPYPPSAEDLGALVTTELFYIWDRILSDSELRELRGRNQFRRVPSRSSTRLF